MTSFAVLQSSILHINPDQDHWKLEHGKLQHHIFFRIKHFAGRLTSYTFRYIYLTNTEIHSHISGLVGDDNSGERLFEDRQIRLDPLLGNVVSGDLVHLLDHPLLPLRPHELLGSVDNLLVLRTRKPTSLRLNISVQNLFGIKVKVELFIINR